MSEWLLLNAKWTNLPLYHGENKSHFQWDDDDVRFELDQHAYLDFYHVSSLKLHSAGRHVILLRKIILILSQLIFALKVLLSAAFIVFALTPLGLNHTLHCTWDKHFKIGNFDCSWVGGINTCTGVHDFQFPYLMQLEYILVFPFF